MYYLFKYGSSYYEKIHGFHLSEETKQQIHYDNINKSNNAKIDDIDEFIKYVKKYDKYNKIEDLELWVIGISFSADM